MQWVVIRFVEFGVEGALHSDIPELLMTGSSIVGAENKILSVLPDRALLLFFLPFGQHLITESPPNQTAPADKLPSASFQSLISRCPYHGGERSE
jgi:hypothetical protein